MLLNLIMDKWISVLRNGRPDTIRPDQIAEDGVEWPNWPRPDLNLACLEFLIGMVYLADPPRDSTDWLDREPDPKRLREAMAPLASAFNLTGEGPRFLQDLEELEGEPNEPDFLFIDSSAVKTAKENADLMVRRGRYLALPLPLAAMALYTLQAFAPSGGAGNRTSMRGGGPMVTLVRPEAKGSAHLWSLVWANVPRGRPQSKDSLERALPWLRPTRTSETGATTTPPESDHIPVETFFGMPRRVRLVTDEAGGWVNGIIQKNYGTNYTGWIHPLSPYYSLKAGSEKLPKHPKPGSFGYRNWLGVILEARDGTSFRAAAIHNFQQQRGGEAANVLVAGWAMDNMKPVDFVWSEQPLFALEEDAEALAVDMVTAAERVAKAMEDSLRKVLVIEKAKATRTSSAREAFYESTQAAFEGALSAMSGGATALEVGEHWLATLKGAALRIFDEMALTGLVDRDLVDPKDGKSVSKRANVKRIVDARRALLRALRGKKIRETLGLSKSSPKSKEAA